MKPASAICEGERRLRRWRGSRLWGAHQRRGRPGARDWKTTGEGVAWDSGAHGRRGRPRGGRELRVPEGHRGRSRPMGGSGTHSGPQGAGEPTEGGVAQVPGNSQNGRPGPEAHRRRGRPGFGSSRTEGSLYWVPGNTQWSSGTTRTQRRGRPGGRGAHRGSGRLGPEDHRGRRRPGGRVGALGRGGPEARRGAVRSHPFRGAGAALQERPVLERRDAVVLEVELPGRGQRRSAHPATATAER